ncbi:MAG: hypothetical protein ACOY3P_12220 [Planctomycetota bacterium]
MNRLLTVAVAAILLAGFSARETAAAEPFNGLGYGAMSCHCYSAPWNGPYYNPAWGIPTALVVPPTAETQVNWGWGVGNTRVSPICPRFTRNYPGPGYYERSLFVPTPPMQSDTAQSGFYYVRGPW